VDGSFLVDTAWRSFLSLTTPFVEGQNLPALSKTRVEAVTGIGIGGPTLDTLVRLPRLELGPYALENVVAGLSHAKAGILSQSDLSGIVGAEVLRRFHVILDYPGGRMFLEPNQAFSTPCEVDMSGFFLTLEGKAFKVAHVIPGAPGDEAGVRAGDLLEEIDGREVSRWSLDEARRLFREAGRRHALLLRRDSKELRVRLLTRRIL
jgi:hypothetical protein